MALIKRKNNTVQDGEIKKRRYAVHNSLVSYYLLIMFSFFTLFLTNKYSSARRDKYYLFLGLTAALVIAAAGAYVLNRFEEKRKGLIPDPFFKPLSVVDIGFIAFYVCAIISALISEHIGETVNASIGRNNGLLLLTAYILAYFVITRMYAYKDYVLAVYLIFSCIIALLTVINFFYFDPLGLLVGYSAEVAEDFGSTIGNKNTIASYMSMFLPISVMISVVSEKRYMRIIAAVGIVFAYTGALSANSSSVIMGMIVAVPVMAIFSARSYEHLTRYMLAMTIMFMSGKVLRLFSYIMGLFREENKINKGFEFIQQFLIYNKLTYLPIIVFGAIWLFMLLMRRRIQPLYPRKALTIVFLIITLSGIFAMLAGTLYFTLIDTEAELGSFDRLLRFDDRWGTHRGFMWIRSIQEYGKFDLLHKLFGAGPDMAYYVLMPHFNELASRFGDGSTNSAHNEYINYLITQGALGLAAYMTVLAGVVIRSVRRAKSNPMLLTFTAAVICYAVQATVNLYQPITTPLFIIFIAIAEALNRSQDRNKI